MSALACKSFNKAALRAPRAQRVQRKPAQVCAAYGQESKYFDLKDLENTTGSWDMYGVDEPKRYPAMQETFFKQAADVLSKREALNSFVAFFGIAAIATFGLKGAKDAALPITKGPTDGKTENGKGGSVRARL